MLEFWLVAAEGTDRFDGAELVRNLITHDPQALLLAEDAQLDGAIVGSVIAGWDGWRCHLYRLAVRPDQRRQGIASTLLSTAERRFRELGGRRFDAMVLDANTEAHPAWAAAGYDPQPEWSRWVKFHPVQP